MTVPMPALPASGSTTWYPWASAVHTNAGEVQNRATASHSHTYGDLMAMVGLIIVETATGVWSNTVPARTAGQYPCVFVSADDPKDATNGVPGKANINPLDTWIPTT